MTSVYMDVCCLNRPFDNQTQDRMRLETAAIVGILRRIELDEYLGVSSEAVQDETDSNPDVNRRVRVQELITLSKRIVTVEIQQITRAAELQGLGFQPFDALHMACAEYAEVSVFLTTDDRLLRLALRLGEKLKVKVANPMAWLLEIDND